MRAEGRDQRTYVWIQTGLDHKTSPILKPRTYSFRETIRRTGHLNNMVRGTIEIVIVVVVIALLAAAIIAVIFFRMVKAYGGKKAPEQIESLLAGPSKSGTCSKCGLARIIVEPGESLCASCYSSLLTKKPD
jgi:hypothetical protein